MQMTCPQPYAACASRRPPRANPAVLAGVAKIAIALAVLYVMFNGERWLLEHSPTGANEMIVATCVVDAVFGDAASTNACSSAATTENKGSDNE